MTPPLTPATCSRFAVVVCTRHAPHGLTDTVRSVLASQPAPDLVVVVDQSDFGTFDGLKDFAHDARFLHLQRREKGVSRARNVGVAAALAAGCQFVACTDDDCVAVPGWLAGFQEVFAGDPRVALVFGTTRPAKHDRSEGVIPGYLVPKTALYRGISSKPRIEAMGACMAFRVDVWREVGGFDERLGAGTPLAAAEENDFSARILLAGFTVAETPDAEVVHWGFRGRDDVHSLVAGYMKGSGAAMAKMMRLAGLASIRPVAAIGSRWFLGRSPIDLGPVPSRRSRLWSFLHGFVIGWTTRIDRRSGCFRLAPATAVIGRESVTDADSHR